MAEVLVPPQFYIANKNPEVLETLRKCFAWQMSDSILCVWHWCSFVPPRLSKVVKTVVGERDRLPFPMY